MIGATMTPGNATAEMIKPAELSLSCRSRKMSGITGAIREFPMIAVAVMAKISATGGRVRAGVGGTSAR